MVLGFCSRSWQIFFIQSDIPCKFSFFFLQLYRNAIVHVCLLIGGSGGGGGAAGGQGSYQTYVGSPPSYSSMYSPREYGGYGGSGGGAQTDSNCGHNTEQKGGEGGRLCFLSVTVISWLNKMIVVKVLSH